MGRLDQARTRKYFKIVNEPEKARTFVCKFLFNSMQNFVQFYFYLPTLRSTAVQH